MGTNFYWERNPVTGERWPDDIDEDDPRRHIGKRSANAIWNEFPSRFTLTDMQHMEHVMMVDPPMSDIVDEYNRTHSAHDMRRIIAECFPVKVSPGRWC